MREGGRIGRRFASLRQQRRAGLVTFVTAGDPDLATSIDIMRRLPAAGADIIELGMPFSDPMADGPIIQAASERALRAGQTMRRTLDMVAAFRQEDAETPIVLMGYFNPVYVYGTARFLFAAKKAGVDGLILVDLPPEEAEEVVGPARNAGIDLIFLVAPTTGDERLPLVVKHASGFVYYVSITGITGTASAALADVTHAVERIRAHSPLPVAVGFGIKSPGQARAIGSTADAAVVGSAIVAKIADHIDAKGAPRADLVDVVASFVGSLAEGVHAARPRRGPA
ncbi:MAG TPA: tryptophan synthase subunit alpha [Defluviicoccus sp.]|nr:tryptophan synthase subunit alpha [Defluviicoccus sp.]